MVHSTPRWCFRFDVIVARHLRRARGGRRGCCGPLRLLPALAVAGLLNLAIVLPGSRRQSCLARSQRWQADGLARLFSHSSLGASHHPSNLRGPGISGDVRQDGRPPGIEGNMDFQELIRIRRSIKAYRPTEVPEDVLYRGAGRGPAWPHRMQFSSPSNFWLSLTRVRAKAQGRVPKRLVLQAPVIVAGCVEPAKLGSARTAQRRRGRHGHCHGPHHPGRHRRRPGHLLGLCL